MTQNILLQKWDTPLESIPFEKIQSKDFIPALKEAIKIHEEDVEKIINNKEKPNFKNTILKLEESWFLLRKIESAFACLQNAKDTKEIKKISKGFIQLSTLHSTNLLLNTKLFDRIKYVFNHSKELRIEGEEFALTEKIYEDFEKSGANCPKGNKEKLLKINLKINELKEKFSENLKKERERYLLIVEDESKIKSMPERDKEKAKELAKKRGQEGFGFQLNRATYSLFMIYCSDRELRKKYFMDGRKECAHGGETDNREIIKRIANLRLKRANLLGYKTHADTILKYRLLKTKEEVISEIKEVFDYSLPIAKKEVKQIEEYARKIEGKDFKLMPWDLAYYSEKYKKENFSVNLEETKEYFELNNAISGIFKLAKEMYGIEFRERKDIQTYDKNVKVYEVKENGKHLALLYLDLFSRPEEKSDGAWMKTIMNQQKLKRKRPHILISTNYNLSKNVLLNPDEVKTFLHEFGHALHAIFSNVKYSSICCTKTSRDFVELPSQVMENFFFEKRFLSLFSKHYRTGKPLPEELFSKLLSLKKFQKGYWYARQAALSMIDNYWHTIENPFEGNPLEIEEEILQKLNLFPVQVLRYRTTTFLHPFYYDYDMGYYSYINAEILSWGMFEFWKKNNFNKKGFDLFRKNILSKGGSEEEKNMYLSVTRNLPNIKEFIRAVIK